LHNRLRKHVTPFVIAVNWNFLKAAGNRHSAGEAKNTPRILAE
jgi:hypothetical protein